MEMVGNRPEGLVLALVSVAVSACGVRSTHPGVDTPPVVEDHPLRVDVPTTFYRCEDGYEFVVQQNPFHDTATLFLPEETVNVPRADAEAGDRYSNDAVDLRIAADGATLRLGEKSHGRCNVDAWRTEWAGAALNAVEWRGVGIDPGWVVEIVEAGGIIFVTSEGRRYEYPGPPDYEGEPGAYVFRSAEAGSEIVIRFREGRCLIGVDELEFRVEIEIDGDEFRGCGRRLSTWSGLAPGK